MFEPLKDLIAPHADDLKGYLHSIECRLGELVENAEAEVQYDQYTTRNGRAVTLADGTALIELTPSEGFSWLIQRVALTSNKAGNCAIYVGAVAPENLVGAFREVGMTSDRGKYFVPRGQSLTFHFYEQPEGQICTANIQAEQLIPVVKAARSVTGRNSEAIDHPRVPPVPSGSPLQEVQIAGR